MNWNDKEFSQRVTGTRPERPNDVEEDYSRKRGLIKIINWVIKVSDKFYKMSEQDYHSYLNPGESK